MGFSEYQGTILAGESKRVEHRVGPFPFPQIMEDHDPGTIYLMASPRESDCTLMVHGHTKEWDLFGSYFIYGVTVYNPGPKDTDFDLQGGKVT